MMRCLGVGEATRGGGDDERNMVVVNGLRGIMGGRYGSFVVREIRSKALQRQVKVNCLDVEIAQVKPLSKGAQAN